jgi:NAD+ kinase
VKKIGVVYNSRSDAACRIADQVADWLAERDLESWVSSVEGQTVPDRLDLLLTLGGDGSILRAAHRIAAMDTPILGVNLGRVGFLTEASPDAWREVLAQVLEGDYWLEERMMLCVQATRDGDSLCEAEALNDVVVGRGARANVVHLRTEVDGGHLTTYVADGLIMATPTGSTAYALAAGGPVMPPDLRNILLVPVAAHLSMAQSIVLPEGAGVRVVVTSGRPAVLTVDGDVHAELQSDDEVVVRAGPHVIRFARVCERTYFYRTLLDRLMPRDHTTIVPPSGEVSGA